MVVGDVVPGAVVAGDVVGGEVVGGEVVTCGVVAGGVVPTVAGVVVSGGGAAMRGACGDELVGTLAKGSFLTGTVVLVDVDVVSDVAGAAEVGAEGPWATRLGTGPLESGGGSDPGLPLRAAWAGEIATVKRLEGVPRVWTKPKPPATATNNATASAVAASRG